MTKAEERRKMLQNTQSISRTINSNTAEMSKAEQRRNMLTNTINPVASTLKNASVIQTANDVKKPTLTYEQAQQIAKENNIKMPDKLTLPNFEKVPIKAKQDTNAFTQSLKNFSTGALSSGANTIEYFQDNNAAANYSARLKAMSEAIKAGDSFNPLKSETYEKTLEEEAQKRYEDTDAVTQRLRNMREKAMKETQNMEEGLGKKIAEGSFVVGDMLPAIGAGAVTGGVGSSMAIYGNAAQSAYQQAIENGATHEQASNNAMLSGGMETGIEMLSGGALNKLGKIPGIANVSKWTKGINNKFVRGGLNLAGDVIGEGLEEVIATELQPIIDQVTYNPNAPLATLQTDWEAFSSSIIPTLMFGGVNVTITQINKLATKQKQTIDKANIPEEQKTELKEQVEQMKNETIQQVNSQTTPNTTLETTPQNNTNLEETSPNQSVDEIKNKQYKAFHGTDFDFDEYTFENFGQHDQGDLGKAIYFSTNKNTAKKYGNNIKETNIELSKPLVLNTEEDYQKMWNDVVNNIEKHQMERIKNNLDNEETKMLADEYTSQADKNYLIYSKLTADEKTKLIKKLGYDGIIDNIYSQIAVFDLEKLNKKNKTSPNTVQTEQNNVQNVQDLQKTVQSDVNNALTRATTNKDSKGKTILGKINDFAKNKIQQLLGKDVSNRQHVLNDNDIRHMLNEHGNPEVESRKGQIAVTQEDIKKIPDILTNPDDIVKGTRNKDGDAIRYVKKYEDNNTFVVEVVPDKGNNLIIKTMWKKPIALADNLIPASTSETQGNLGNSTSNINNIIPTSQNYVNNNLPTQAEQQQAQQELRNKLPTEENRLNMKKPKLEEIAELTQEQAELPTMSYKQNADKDTPYRRKFWDNVESSKIISKEVKEQVNMTNYERKHNADVLEKMKERLDTEPMKVAQEWFGKDIKKATDQDVALGAILMERYQAEGRFDEAVDVVEKLADMGTEAGRTVQMYSIFQRLTPEGMMIYQQRKLNSALETLTQKQTGKWVEQNKDKFKLTEDDATFITAKVQEAQNAPTERQKQIALAEIETRINDKLPPEAGQSVKAFRRIAMLFNPKTQVRNIAGNVTVMPLNYVTDLVATGIDKAIAKKTGVRTTALPNVKTIGKGFKKGASETIDDYKRGIRTTPTGSRYEIQNNAKSFNENTNSKVKNAINKKMNAIDRILSTTLELGDRPFYEAAYQNALETQMKANGVTEPTQEMIDIASNVALSQTWQDNNNYTQAVLGIRSAFNKININGFGLGDLIIPFAKTPANLTKAMIDYSPAGFIPALINYNDMRKAISRGDMTAMQQKRFVTSAGKAMAGTILYAIAEALVKGGKITGSSDEDKDVANFEKNVLGIQPYSIKTGDKTFTYNWANPIATPFAIMADTYKMSEEGAKWNEILLNGFKVAGDQLVANSFLQGIQELLSSEYGNESAMDNLVGAIMDLPTQFTPTLLGQIATQFDSTKRQTFENGDSVGTMINEVKNKIPGLRNELAPQVNTFGEEIQNYGGDNNPFNVFLNPGNISSTNATETQKELYKLYQDTKDKTIFPAQAPYSISGGGEKVTLSSKDRADYQKTSGQFVTKNLDALFNSEYYKSLDNDKKAEVVSEIVADANTLAKGEYLETKASKELKEKLSKLGDIPYVEYYNAWSATRGIESDKNWKGESISGSKKKKQMQAINNAVSKDLTTKQRETLYGILNVSGY